MAHIQADRVKETTTTTGTGAITLAGAASGFRAFSAVMAAADTCFYTIAGGAEWETGLGTFSTTLARTTVLSSSNAGAAVTFSAGAKDVFITVPAARLLALSNELATLLPNVGTSTDPSTPASGFLAFYAKQIAGRMFPKVKGPSGLDYPLQASLWQNNITWWNPSSVTAGVWVDTVGAGAGTYSFKLPTTTSIYTSMRRGAWANVVTTTNQVLGQRGTEAMFMRGSATGQGGFFFYARAGLDVWTNGGRFFAGMHTATTVISADPSALANTCGFMSDAADNGLIYFGTRDGATSNKTSTGFTIVTGKGYDLYMFAAPNGSSISWRIVDFNAGTEASGTTSTNLPVNTTLLTAGVLASNAALTPVTSINLGVNRIYIETDY
jgi:hypothetical protein